MNFQKIVKMKKKLSNCKGFTRFFFHTQNCPIKLTKRQKQFQSLFKLAIKNCNLRMSKDFKALPDTSNRIEMLVALCHDTSAPHARWSSGVQDIGSKIPKET